MAVALYARVSTAKQAEKDLSIPDQLNQMRAWCEANGYSIAKEYIEPGASATDDRRPVFQQMIADATDQSMPFEAVIVHSRSRFFRDLFEFLSYERMLGRAGCRILSITQQTSDDPAGEMANKIFSLFDEYQSKENGKHTLRAMKENARQGFFNGSRPPFGYRTVEAEKIGNKGKRKKRLAIDQAEASTVKRIFDMYLDGLNGRSVGVKEIAEFLNNRNISLRGQPWTKSRIHEVLANSVYIGEYYFNKRDQKTKRMKPESEWVRLTVEPIIEAERFEGARCRCAGRAPSKIPPRVVGSPTLLTGLLKCAHCGAGMTLATGKGDELRAAGVRPALATMLFGAPGTGKTMLAHNIAAQLELPLIVARLDGLISSFLGTTARNISNLFSFANRYKSVLLLDEFDAVAKLRDDPHELGEIKRVVNTLLQCIDSRSELGFTIAITNHESLLDPAVWRRFDIRIEVPKPNAVARTEILRRQFEVADLNESNIRFLAWLTEGGSGSDVEKLADFLKRQQAIQKSNFDFFSAVKGYIQMSAHESGSLNRTLLSEDQDKLARALFQDQNIPFSQDQIATLFGCTQPTISRWLKNKATTGVK